MARAKREAATRARLGLRVDPEPRVLPQEDAENPPAQEPDSSSDDGGEGEGTDNDQVPAETGDDPDYVDQDGDGTSLEPSSKPPNKKQRRGSSGAKSKSDNDDDDEDLFSDDDDTDAEERAANLERFRIAKARAKAVMEGRIEPSAKPLLAFLVRLGFDDMAACRVINVERLEDAECLASLDDERISAICKVHRRSDSSMLATYISASGEHNLKLAVFCLKHLKNTGRSYALGDITRRLVDSYKSYKATVDAFVQGSIDAPVFTDKSIEKDPDHAWEVLNEYLSAVRDVNGIPLFAWCQADAKLWPPLDGDDPESNYFSRDDELIARAPIILEMYREQTPALVTANKSWWTPLFAEGNVVLYNELYQILGTLKVWENAKGATRAKNGRKAYLGIYNALFGANVIFHRSDANMWLITSLTYEGNRRNFTLDDYVNRHLMAHNQRATLSEHATALGKVIHPFTEYDKVGHFLMGIKQGHLESCKANIIGNEALRNNFEGAVRQVRDYMESTGNTNERQGHTNRNISAVDRGGGRGGGGRANFGGGRGGGGRQGRGGNRKDTQWTQAGVDRCTHITLTRYPGHQYHEFNADEKQKVFQNKNGRPRNAGPSPPGSVSLSELSSSVSALRDTVEEQQ